MAISVEELKSALKGREDEVLSALGINGFESGRHINCPLPDHGGESDWRWDSKNARFICTCSHGDIFDLVRKMRSCNFREAVEFIAGVLGIDTTESRHDNRAGRMKPSNVFTVLTPGERVRDDSALPAYFANRLGVDTADVPELSTSFAGHRAALYWTADNNGKLLKIGTFPMIAFEMIGPDGRQHAHRIYVAPGGAGKAEITHPETGELLDPKKLMPVPEGEPSVAGLAVIFGDTEAPVCLVAEGIETAAAIAYACKAEVTSGKFYVAAAITAGGVEAFKPWSKTKKLVVMADRDERAKGRGKKASRRGEEAARKLCLRLQKTEVETFIALPGDPGESVDWLDILRRDGVKAVRMGVKSKKKFEPTPDELREFERTADLANDDRPTIEIQPGKLHELVDQCAVTIGPSQKVFKRGTMLVHAARVADPTAHMIERPRGSLIVAPVDENFLRVTLAEVASVVKWDGRAKGFVHVDPPASLAAALMACPDRWGPIPALRSISEAPIITSEGRIISTSGLDQETLILFDIGGLELSVSEKPDKDDARAALDKLKDLLGEFAFADDASRSVALCELLTPFVRPLLPAAPMFINEAPKAGSGKSQLARLPGLLATGRPPAVMSQPENTESESKRLFSVLMEGADVAVIDNIERPLKSDLLCSILTEPTIRDRILGASKTATVPTASTWIATGNNLRVVGDLTRRVLSCSIDPGLERPEERAFNRDIDRYTIEHRARLVSAALTIIKAYIASAERVDLTPFNSFGAWSRMVREPLVWLGGADPCSTRSRIVERDPIAQGLGNFLEIWDLLFGDEPMTAAAALSVANSHASGITNLETDARDAPSIVEAFCGITSDGRMPNARQLGNYLTRFDNRIERGRRIVKVGTRKRAVVWKLINTNYHNYSSEGELVSYVSLVTSHTEKCQKRKSHITPLTNMPGGQELNSPKLTNSPSPQQGDQKQNSDPDSESNSRGGSILL